MKRRRIEIDLESRPIDLDRRILHEIYAHALETSPEECCGLLSGRKVGVYRAIHRCRNDMTQHHERDAVNFPRDGREGFYMNANDYRRAIERAEVAGEQITAVYHSHVGYGAYFSEMDQEFVERPLYPFPQADHIVLSLIDGKVGEMGLFRRDSNSGAYRGWRVVAEDE